MVAPAHPSRSFPPGRIADLATQALVWLAVSAVVVIAFAITPNLADRFRLVKETVLRAEAVAGVLLMTVAIAFGGTGRIREMSRRRGVLLLVAAAVLWSGVAAASSTTRPLSTESLVSVICAAALFIVVWYAAPRIPLLIFDALVVTCAINTILAALQEYKVWQPFHIPREMEGHMSTNALIDNPNVLGSYLAIAALALTVAALHTAGWRRGVYGAGATIAVAGVVVSQTRTAMIMLIAVAVIAGAVRSWKWAVMAALLVSVVLMGGVLTGSRAARRLVALPRIMLHDPHVATSGRIIPYVAAWHMFLEDPVTGVGPGAYGYHYMKHQMRLTAGVPWRSRFIIGTNFNETHNDHLQVLAETGLAGFLILTASIVVLARAGRFQGAAGARAQISGSLAFPLAVAFTVLALAQFPLQVAVTRHLLLTLSALVIGWRET